MTRAGERAPTAAASSARASATAGRAKRTAVKTPRGSHGTHGAPAIKHASIATTSSPSSPSPVSRRKTRRIALSLSLSLSLELLESATIDELDHIIPRGAAQPAEEAERRSPVARASQFQLARERVHSRAHCGEAECAVIQSQSVMLRVRSNLLRPQSTKLTGHTAVLLTSEEDLGDLALGQLFGEERIQRSRKSEKRSGKDLVWFQVVKGTNNQRLRVRLSV